ncbi:MAG: proline dehydrogenase family protein [Candidatus Limnocylindria bacterium]
MGGNVSPIGDGRAPATGDGEGGAASRGGGYPPSLADRAAAAYVATIDRIGFERLEANVSIKLSQTGLDLGDDECLAVLEPVVAVGTRHGIFVRIDMESSAYTERTLRIVHRLRAPGHDVGPVIQSYLHRSKADVERLATERVRTRVCEGAYAEPPDVAPGAQGHWRRSRGALRSAPRGRCLPGRGDPRPRDDRARVRHGP